MSDMVDVDLRHETVIGFAPILDEADCIRGWAENIREFCNVAYAVIDPRCKDDTIDILRSEYPEVRLFWQNVDNGDSTRYDRGRTGTITYIREVNRFLHSMVRYGTWCLWLAGDERLDPRDAETIRWHVDRAETQGCDNLVFNFVDFYGDDKHVISYEKANIRLAHKKFFKRSRRLRFHSGAHAGESGMYNSYNTGLDFFHFGHARQDLPCWWRDWGDGPKLPGAEIVERESPFVDWRASSGVRE